jgi:hypothetical protein
VGLEIAQLERELLVHEHLKSLRALPEEHLLEVCIATRSFSFSASSASTISVRADGSVGRASGPRETPLRRATSEMFALSSKLSATIWAFSLPVHRRLGAPQ